MRGHSDNHPRESVEQIGERLVAMHTMVESLFADAVVAFLDASPDMVRELRQDDYRAHEEWVEVDHLAVDLLCQGTPERHQVRFLTTAMKIAEGLKRAADESLRIGESLRDCQLETLQRADSLPRMIELTQSMLGDVAEAFVNSDPAEASALHLVFRELTGLRKSAVEDLTANMADGRLSIPVGVALVDVARRLEQIGDEVLGISNQVSHLYREQGAG